MGREGVRVERRQIRAGISDDPTRLDIKSTDLRVKRVEFMQSRWPDMGLKRKIDRESWNRQTSKVASRSRVVGWVVVTGLVGCLSGAAAQAQDPTTSPPAAPGGSAQEAVSSPESLAAFSKAATYQNNRAFDLAAESWAGFLDKYPDDPRAIDAEYHLGVCYLELKQYKKARASLQGALARGPSFARREDALLNLGWAIYTMALQDQVDLFANAEQVFAKLLADFPDGKYRDQAWFLRGEALYMQGNRAEAAKAYQQLVSNHADSDLLSNGLYALGVTFEELGDYAKSSEIYDRFLAEFADNALAPEVTMRKAETLLQKGDVAAAEEMFAAVSQLKEFEQADHARYRHAYCIAQQERFQEAADAFAALVRDFPNSRYQGDAIMAAGRAYFRAEKNEQAAEWFDRLLDSKGPAASEAAHWRARLYLKEGEPETALLLVNHFLPVARENEHPFRIRLQMDQADAIYEIPDRRADAVDAYLQLVADAPEHSLAPQALYNAAFGALQRADYRQSLELTERFIADFPDHRLESDVRRVAAEAHLQQGDSAIAAEAFSALAQQHPDARESSQLRLREAVALYALGRHESVLKKLNAILDSLKKPEQRAEAHYLIGMSHLGLKQYDQACDYLARALTSTVPWPQADDALLSLARAEHQRGNTTKAKSLAQRLPGDYPRSRLRDEAIYRTGEYAYALKQYDEAARAYQQVVTQWPDSSFVPFALYGRGWSHLRKEDLDQAVEDFDALQSKYPGHAITKSALYARALARQQAGQYEDALRDLEAFLKNNVSRRERSDALYVRGLCLVGLKQYDDAAVVLGSILQEDENYQAGDKVLYELAWSQKLQDLTEPALSTFQQLASRYPQSVFAAESLYHLGEAKYELKDFDAAVASYLAALKHSTDQNDLTEKIQYKRGWSLYQQEKFNESMKAFGEQLKAAPHGDLSGDALFMQGECQFKLGNYQNALQRYDQACRRQMSSDQITTLAHLHAGQAAAQLALWRESEVYLSDAAKKFPDSPLTLQISYETAVAQQNLGRLDDAERMYAFVADRAEGALAARSRFMLGEMLYAKSEHVQAIREFRKVMFGFDAELDGEVAAWQAKSGFEAGQCAGILASQQSSRSARQQFLDLATQCFQYVQSRHPETDEALAATEQLKKFGVIER